MDDDRDLLEGLRRMLALDYEVVTHTDPLAALELLRGSDFDVVISDLRMPRMSGTQFLAYARRILPAAPRLLLSGVPDLTSAIAAINDGAVFRYLVKPCPREQLLAALQAAVAERRSLLARQNAVACQDRGHRSAGRASRTRAPRERSRRDPVSEWGAPSRDSRERSAAPDPAPVAPICSVRADPPEYGPQQHPPRTMGALARVADAALREGRVGDAERLMDAPLKTLLKDARAGYPTNPEDADSAAVLAARLAAATRNPTWLDYPFRLFGALRRLLSNEAIDAIQAALYQVRGAKPDGFQLYIGVLAFHGRSLSPSERCLLKRIQQCRALMAMPT